MARTTSMPRKVIRDFGKSVSLDGSTNGVTIGGTFSMPQTSFSVALFLRVKNIANNARIFDLQEAGPTNGCALTYISSTNTIDFVVNNAGAETARVSSNKVKRGEWQFIVATYESNSAKLYLDSALYGSDTVVTMSTSAAVPTIGKRSTTAANYAHIDIDNFMIFNSVLTQGEIDDIFYSDIHPSSMVLKLKFEDDVNDSSGNGNNGTEVGSLTYLAKSVFSPRLTVS